MFLFITPFYSITKSSFRIDAMSFLAEARSMDNRHFSYNDIVENPILCNYLIDENSELSQKYREIKHLLAEIEQRQQQDLDDY